MELFDYIEVFHKHRRVIRHSARSAQAAFGRRVMARGSHDGHSAAVTWAVSSFLRSEEKCTVHDIQRLRTSKRELDEMRALLTRALADAWGGGRLLRIAGLLLAFVCRTVTVGPSSVRHKRCMLDRHVNLVPRRS
jgi:hypothetical protein